MTFHGIEDAYITGTGDGVHLNVTLTCVCGTSVTETVAPDPNLTHNLWLAWHSAEWLRTHTRPTDAYSTHTAETLDGHTTKENK